MENAKRVLLYIHKYISLTRGRFRSNPETAWPGGPTRPGGRKAANQPPCKQTQQLPGERAFTASLTRSFGCVLEVQRQALDTKNQRFVRFPLNKKSERDDI